MTGGSLGLRSGSYGSLQQVHNAAAAVTFPISTTPPVSVRKNSKMLLPGYREKDNRRLSWIFKLASRKKVGMLLLLVITSVAVVLSFLFVINVDQPAGPETVVGFSDHISNLVNHGRLPSNYLSHSPAPVTEYKENIMSVFNIQIDNVTNEIQPLPFFNPAPIPLRHPCENFSLPDSPVDPKRTGPRPCDVCYVPVDLAMAYMPTLPSASPVLKNLYYVSEENLVANESNGGSIFGGHPSLQLREESFDIKETMTMYCGFAKGKKPGQGTGFDIDEADLLEMEQCRGVVVASAIFGNYDIMQQPRNISEASMRTVCFYMFVDEETEASLKNSTTLDSSRKIGLWRVVVVRNLPYEDARRSGKVYEYSP